jgi:uncharacterized membrane protein
MFRTILTVLVISFQLLCNPIDIIASDYSLPDIRIDIEITPLGVVHIAEHRTYYFEGSFSWADYRLPKKGFTEIQNIRVLENGEPYINDNSESPGTFSVSENDRDLIIKWHYRAEDESRTFTVSYELTEVLSVGPDFTEFFWNYLGAGRDKNTDVLDISISFPDGISTDSLHVWSRGFEPVSIDHVNSGLYVSAEMIPRDQSIQIRSLFPASVLDQLMVPINTPELTLEQVIQEEETVARERQEQRERDELYASITPTLTLLICLISFAVFILLYHRYGKRHTSGSVSTRETIMIPGRIKPAIIGRLMMQRHTSIQHVSATLFDLARRGWFTIHEVKKEKSWFSSDENEFRIKYTDPIPDDSLEDWEKDLFEFIKRRIISGHDTLEKLFKSSDSSVSGWFSSWKKDIKAVFDKMEWIDKNSYKGVYLNIAIQFILLISSITLALLGTALAIAGVVIVCMMMAGSFLIIRRTQTGEEVYQRWKAYINGLKNADKRTIRMDMLDRHFIYATAFHLSENQIKKVIESAEDQNIILFPWIYLMAGSTHTPASVAGSMAKLPASGSSSFSGTSGGTGATMGSAGGGATGGAG